MKKYMVLFTLLSILIIFVIGILGVKIINDVYQNEINVVENVAGAVLSEYPQAENDLMTAVLDDDFIYADKGSEILAKFGYNRDLKPFDDPAYRLNILMFFLLLLGLLIITLLIIYFYFYNLKKQVKQQEDAVLNILEGCLADRYNVLQNQELRNDLQNSAVANDLFKLCEVLQMKTEYLAQEKDNTKTLVTDISHQLKTPVSALKTCFDMYLQSDSEKEKAEFLNRSLVQMDKLESLISSLVNISRLESSMITLQKEKCLISEILIGAVDSVYHKASQKGILLETFDFDDCGLTLDKKWTIEAIANILDNSIKYSPANSKIQITLTKLYSFLRIEISDEGIGIPKDEKNLIFKRFYRGNSAIVKENDGSGVGLYLTRKILEDQGGTISVTDNNPVGSIFIIQLPF